MSIVNLNTEYPLHKAIWYNHYLQVASYLESPGFKDIEQLDPHGRTPLMLSVTLGHLETTAVILQHSPNVNASSEQGWSVVQEAVAVGDPELLKIVLERRDVQRYSNRINAIPELLHQLELAPDFYLEMKWEFTSWVPLVSRICPSDTYRIYKSGSLLRIDTTLLGFERTSWKRGNRSFIFNGRIDGADIFEVDHDSRDVYIEYMRILTPSEMEMAANPTDDNVSSRLTSPLVLTYLDTEKVNFERCRTGFWRWASCEKSEMVSGFECKVYSANNVDLVTMTRTEHLTEANKKQYSKCFSSNNPLQAFLGTNGEKLEGAVSNENTSKGQNNVTNPCGITCDEYFSGVELGPGMDIGRPREVTKKVQSFKAQIYLSEDYPLSLQEQVMPIIDLVAISSVHFQKLKEFITCSIPSGFPVKIEIPLFHILNARITFGNIFGLDEAVSGVNTISRDDVFDSDNERNMKNTSCMLDKSVFEIPPGYVQHNRKTMAGNQNFHDDDEDAQYLQFSLSDPVVSSVCNEGRPVEVYQNNEDLDQAIELSRIEMEEYERRRLEEEKILQQVLDLSFVDN